jgi:hypothetical protein
VSDAATPRQPEGPASAPAPVAAAAPACDGSTLRADGLAAPAFQRAVLEDLATTDGLSARSLGPFRLRLGHLGRQLDVRLDELYKRHRHGELEPSGAAEEIRAALGLGGTAVHSAGPFPRLARPADLPPGAAWRPCPFDPELAVFLVRTLPSGHIPLDAAAAGNGDEAWDEALANLRRLTLDVPADADGPDEALVVRFRSGDGFDAARALLDDLVGALAGAVSGALRLAIPSRDLLLAAGADDPAWATSLAAEAAERFRRDPYALSPRWYTLADDGSLVRLDPDPAGLDPAHGSA